MKRRGAVVLLMAAGIVVALLAALAAVSFDATALGSAVLARAASATGITLRARSFRLRPATGLSIDGLEGTAAFDGGRATIAIERLVLDHRLSRLLVGELAVDRLVLRRPQIRLVETKTDTRAPRAPAAAGAASLGRLVLRVSRIDLEDGRIELQALGEPKPVVVSGLDVSLRDVGFDARQGALLAGLSGTGGVRVREVAFARSKASEIRGDLKVGGGKLTTGTVRFQTPQGPFQGTLEARLDRLPFAYTLALTGDPLDVRSMMTVASGSGRGPGPATLRLDARGLGAEATGLKGKGVLRLAAGELPATPLLAGVERALGRTHLVGARYEATEAPFRVEGGRVLLDTLRLRTTDAGLDVGGWASLDGPLELSVAVLTARAGLTVEGVAGSALDLMTDAQGRVVVPFKITGTQEQPRIRPDAAALADNARRQGTRSLLEKAGHSLGDLLKTRPHP